MSVDLVTRMYVATCRRDLHLTRLCVASIRYWHPDIPVSLVVDDNLGPCDTRRIERDWNVQRFPTAARSFGGGTSKLEMHFRTERERYLVLDSDIVLLGPILDLLNQTAGDFVVHPDIKSPKERDARTYNAARLVEFDPSFVPPERVFNSGQLVATSGLLRREDFDPMLEWTEPRRPKRPDIFHVGEQGMLNYVLTKAEAAGRLSLTWQPMFLWKRQDSSEFTIEKIAARATSPMLMHWCGYRPDRIEMMERPDILAFYRDFERRKVRVGSRFAYWKQDNSADEWSRRWRRFRRSLRYRLAGTPFAGGGLIGEIPLSQLHRFHEIEKADGVAWCWCEPDAAVDLALAPGNYRVRIETGSPLPMGNLAEKNLHFFIDDQPLPPGSVHVIGGAVEVELRKSDFVQRGRVMLKFTLDPIHAPQDDRPLGMPISAIYVFGARTAAETAR